jgi:predicted alpha/beta superfamily hydrolase
MLKKHIILLFIFSVTQVISQSKTVSLGELTSIKSTILKETREIQIYLPPSYNSQKKFPVLYVLDGQRYFLNGISFQQNLTWQHVVPEFIVVGIPTDNQKRRNLFFQNSTKFIQFLEKELIPKINSTYKTSDESIYFGWEMAAGLGFEILASKTNLFSGYLLSSPTHLTKERELSLQRMLSTKVHSTYRIYSTLGQKENWAAQSMELLDSIFKTYTSKNRIWKYNLSKTDNHYTTPLTTINEGLKLFFNDYKPLRFYSINEYIKFGGIKSLKIHYNNRGKRYQTFKDIHVDTKHYLLLQTIKENNFKLFQQLIQQLNGKSFIKEYYKNPRWHRRFIIFYLENNELNEAKTMINFSLKKYPNSSILLFTKGDFYKKLGDTKSTKLWYKKAIEVAYSNNEEELEFYKSALKKIH